MKLDAAGNVYITGSFQGTADFDPNPIATANLISEGGSNPFVARYDANGNYVFAQSLAGIGNFRSNAIALDLVGNAYVAGDFLYNMDTDPSPGSTNSITSINGYNIFFAKYSIGIIIPLHLIKFSAALKNNIAQLGWTTAYEQNTSHFNIQRSMNSSDFEEIFRVTAAGNSSNRLNYFATDNLSAELMRLPVIYYRLQMIDKDGLASYSRVQAVKPGADKGSVTLIGNPVSQEAVLLYENSFSDFISIRFVNTAGIVMMVQKIPVIIGTHQIAVSTRSLPTGLYFIETMLDDTKTIIRMMKK